jgi:hypothetical protein
MRGRWNDRRWDGRRRRDIILIRRWRSRVNRRGFNIIYDG